MEQKTGIILIPVVYNNPEECVRYLQSVIAADLSAVWLTVIVADNSTADNRYFFKDIHHENLRFIYYHTGSNLGYMNAGNAAYERYVKNKLDFDILMVSNTDLVIQDTDFFNVLVKKSATYGSDVCLLAPFIRSSVTGRNLNPQLIRKPGKNYVNRLRFFYSNPVLYNILVCLSWIKNKYFKHAAHIFSGTPIYAAHGSLFLFRKQYFEAGCNINFPFFLFGEEIFVAEQVKERNKKIVYVDELKIVHNEHSSTGMFKWGRRFGAIRQTRSNMKTLYRMA